MASFDWKESIEESIKDGLIITAITTRIFYVLNAANVKPSTASLDAMDIMKLAGGTKSDTTKNFMALLRAIKLHNAKCRSI